MAARSAHGLVLVPENVGVGVRLLDGKFEVVVASGGRGRWARQKECRSVVVEVAKEFIESGGGGHEGESDADPWSLQGATQNLVVGQT